MGNREAAEAIAPLLGMIGEQAWIDPEWTRDMLDAAARELSPGRVVNIRRDQVSLRDRFLHLESQLVERGAQEFFALAHAYAQGERLEDALYWASRGIALEPENGEQARFMASLQERAGRLEDALRTACSAKACGADPQSIAEDEIRIRDKVVEQARSQLLYGSRADMLAASSIILNCGTEKNFIEIAHDLAGNERLDEALQWLSEAAQRRPLDGEHLRFRASLLERMGLLDEALQTADEALNGGGDTVALASDIERVKTRRLELLSEQQRSADPAISLTASLRLMEMMAVPISAVPRLVARFATFALKMRRRSGRQA